MSIYSIIGGTILPIKSIKIIKGGDSQITNAVEIIRVNLLNGESHFNPRIHARLKQSSDYPTHLGKG
jgi:hypothetical protein